MLERTVLDMFLRYIPFIMFSSVLLFYGMVKMGTISICHRLNLSEESQLQTQRCRQMTSILNNQINYTCIDIYFGNTCLICMLKLGQSPLYIHYNKKKVKGSLALQLFLFSEDRQYMHDERKML